MNRDDTGTTRARGRNKIGTVQNIQGERHQFERERKAFETMMAGRPQFLPSEIRLRDNGCRVFATGEQNKIVIVIYERERLCEPQNILTDSGFVIVHESRVNSDLHKPAPRKKVKPIICAERNHVKEAVGMGAVQFVGNQARFA